MKKMKRIFRSLTLVAMGALAMVSCKKEKIAIQFAADLEQPQVYQSGKNYLYNEHFILWEYGDSVALTRFTTFGGKDTLLAHCVTSGSREANLWANAEENAVVSDGNDWYGFLPSRVFDIGSSSTDIRINYPARSAYRNDRDDADFTFGKGAFPMVAWRSPSMTSMGFHSVNGIVRVQLFTDTELGTATVDSVQFTSVTQGPVTERRKVSGSFTVNGIKTNTPWLSPHGTAAERDYNIAITHINQPVGSGQLLTFYLPLPAQSDGSGDNLTKYALQMTVYASGNRTFRKGFLVDVRRNCLTMVPAIEIKQWAQNTEGNATVHLVGCGTKERPFQIYTFSELVKARDACNATNGTINGQAITENTYIKVVRADIRLDYQVQSDMNQPAGDPNYHYGVSGTLPHSQWQTCGVWDHGFQNFRGHFICSSNHPTLHGIINNSHAPLFESISEKGHLDSVTVRGNIEVTGSHLSSDYKFSPLCRINEGTMSNCVNQVNVSCVEDNVAGICIENKGRGIITGCRNEGSLTTTQVGKSVAGICLENLEKGTVRNCVGLATAILSGTYVGGLVYINKNKVESCYINMNNANATGHLGCIVYHNKDNGGTVQNCYVAGSLKTQTGYSVGGICNISDGNVLGCYNNMLMLQGSGRVGGIVAKMNGGVVRNCYVDGGGTITTNTDQVECGGLVGYLTGGTIDNCFNTNTTSLGHTNSGSHVGCGVGNIAASSPVRLWNVYASFNVGFYGTCAGDATIDHCYARTVPAGSGLIGLDMQGLNQVTLQGGGNLKDSLQYNLAHRTNRDDRYFAWRNGNHPTLSASDPDPATTSSK